MPRQFPPGTYQLGYPLQNFPKINVIKINKISLEISYNYIVDAIYILTVYYHARRPAKKGLLK